MKKIKSFAFVTLLISSFAIVSCDGDVEPLDPALADMIDDGDDDGGGPVDPAGVAGTYKLTAFNSSVPMDLNNDGTPSTNQMNETACFNNMLLVLNANNTFTADSKGVEIGVDETQIECFVDPSLTGTWVVVGNQLVLAYTDGGEEFTENYTIVGNTLRMTIDEGELVGNEGGVYAYLTADLEIIYNKQ